MLIVNADDLGASVSATDPVIAAFDAGLITSASAMVWMDDSERAAELAREHRLPVGLHLNLTHPLGAGAPSGARELLTQLSQLLARRRWPTSGRDPRIREAITAQLEAFRALYGEPTHFDGHHHVHVHPMVLACLPRGVPIRPRLRTAAALRERYDRRDRRIRRGFVTADGCVSFRQVHSAFGATAGAVSEYAREHVLEVVVHPQRDDERRALHTPEWRVVLAEQQLGSYRDLAVR